MPTPPCDDHAAILAYLGTIPELEADAITLYVQNGMEPENIAAVIGTDFATARRDREVQQLAQDARRPSLWERLSRL